VDSARAREMCIRLSDFLRISLGLGSRPTIPLVEELDLARNYLELERVRFSDRLRVEIEIQAGCENCAVPALLLQPLVENAVKHGIAGLVEGGTIRLEARRDAAGVVVTVTNPFDPEAPPPSAWGRLSASPPPPGSPLRPPSPHGHRHRRWPLPRGIAPAVRGGVARSARRPPAVDHAGHARVTAPFWARTGPG